MRSCEYKNKPHTGTRDLDSGYFGFSADWQEQLQRRAPNKNSKLNAARIIVAGVAVSLDSTRIISKQKMRKLFKQAAAPEVYKEYAAHISHFMDGYNPESKTNECWLLDLPAYN